MRLTDFDKVAALVGQRAELQHHLDALPETRLRLWIGPKRRTGKAKYRMASGEILVADEVEVSIDFGEFAARAFGYQPPRRTKAVDVGWTGVNPKSVGPHYDDLEMTVALLPALRAELERRIAQVDAQLAELGVRVESLTTVRTDEQAET